MAPWSIISAVVSLVVAILLIVACATSWYTNTEYYHDSECYVIRGHFTEGVRYSCTDDCPPAVSAHCKAHYKYVKARCGLNNLFTACQYDARADVIRASIAMCAIGSIVALVNFVLHLLFFLAGSVAALAPVVSLRGMKIGFILSIAILILALLALLIMGGGFYNAYKNDTGCKDDGPAKCQSLFDKEFKADDKSYTERGFGVGYWMALASGVVSIVLIVFSFFAAGEGGK